MLCMKQLTTDEHNVYTLLWVRFIGTTIALLSFSYIPNYNIIERRDILKQTYRG